MDDTDAHTLCSLCGGFLKFIVRISMPRQGLFQCDGCREFAWIADRPADTDKSEQE